MTAPAGHPPPHHEISGEVSGGPAGTGWLALVPHGQKWQRRVAWERRPLNGLEFKFGLPARGAERWSALEQRQDPERTTTQLPGESSATPSLAGRDRRCRLRATTIPDSMRRPEPMLRRPHGFSALSRQRQHVVPTDSGCVGRTRPKSSTDCHSNLPSRCVRSGEENPHSPNVTIDRWRRDWVRTPRNGGGSNSRAGRTSAVLLIPCLKPPLLT